MIEIIRYIDSPNKLRHLNQIKEIFFETSSLEWSSDTEKQASFKKWTQYYFNRYPEWIYIAIKGGQCVAYVMTCPNSEKAENLFQNFLSYDLFEDQFTSYPAHLHINIHPELHGQGIGKLLVERVASRLEEKKLEGLHIVTSPESKNVGFYKKMGFSYQLQRDFKNLKLLFMGKKILSA